MDVVPEIIATSISEAIPAIKTAALYFPQINVNKAALGLARIRTRPSPDGEGFTAYVQEGDPNDILALDGLALLEAEGVVRTTGVPADRPLFLKHLQAWMDGLDEIWPSLAKEAGLPTLGQTSEGYRDLLKCEATAVTLMIMAEGVPTTDKASRRALFLTSYRKALAEMSDAASEAAAPRLRRDIAAYSTMQRSIIWASDMSFEDILEAREACTDSLTMFKAKFAEFTSEMTEAPISSEFNTRCEDLFENEVAPALVEFRRQLRDRRIQTIARSVGGLPYAAGFLGLSFLTQIPWPAALGLSGLSAAAYAAYQAMQYRFGLGQHGESSAMSILLEKPPTGRNRTRKSLL